MKIDVNDVGSNYYFDDDDNSEVIAWKILNLLFLQSTLKSMKILIFFIFLKFIE